MKLYRQFVSSALFPMQERLKGHNTVAVRKALERSQWLTTDELLERQLRDLRKFLGRIGVTVPYYRELFSRHGIDAQAINSRADLQCLPLLDKQSIRDSFASLQREDARNLVRSNTGGSSGEPLTFLLGRERVSHDVAAKWRATRWWDVDIGDPEIVLWGSPIELGSQDRVRLWRDRMMRTELLPAFEMSHDNMDRFLARILAKRPRMLFGYPSSLALLAEHAETKGVAVNNVGIRVAFVTSERLYDYQREAIERVFACPVANGYGGRDAGFIAHECPAGSLHITAEDIIVEILDDAGSAVPDGDPGEIVVTHLRTGDFPFVRYRTGDVGALATRPCSCGRGLPVLASIDGRSTDFLIASDGSVMHALALIYPLREMPEVGEFRIVQETLQETTVEVVALEGYSEQTEHQIVSKLRERLGSDVSIIVRRVGSIARERSGKFRYVVSKVSRSRAPAV